MLAPHLVPGREDIEKPRMRLEVQGEGKKVEWVSKMLERFQHHGELQRNMRYTTAACAHTNPHFPLRWPSRRLCCRCASSLVTLIGFSHERALKQLI